jgi:hypothetical protein
MDVFFNAQLQDEREETGKVAPGEFLEVYIICDLLELFVDDLNVLGHEEKN